jgi:hypothetical protein
MVDKVIDRPLPKFAVGELVFQFHPFIEKWLDGAEVVFIEWYEGYITAPKIDETSGTYLGVSTPFYRGWLYHTNFHPTREHLSTEEELRKRPDKSHNPVFNLDTIKRQIEDGEIGVKFSD